MKGSPGKPPRYRAVRSNVIDANPRVGDEGQSTLIIHADNPSHCKALVTALNAYEDGLECLRHIIEISEKGSDCYRVALSAVKKIERVITLQPRDKKD